MSCFFIPTPKVTVCYCYPRMGGEHDVFASRFADTFKTHDAGHAHELVVVSNGGRPTGHMQATFDGIQHRFIEHDDSGWDIGAFQAASRQCESDLIVFLGGSSHFARSGWLARMVSAWQKHGLGMYGAMGNTGNMGFNVHPHLRTTGFWMPPALMNSYPNTVRSNAERYPFEHGLNSISKWVWSLSLECRLVTWCGEYTLPDWNNVANTFWKGDQSNLVVRDKLCCPPFYHG